jgi:hypothetical protein
MRERIDQNQKRELIENLGDDRGGKRHRVAEFRKELNVLTLQPPPYEKRKTDETSE